MKKTSISISTSPQGNVVVTKNIGIPQPWLDLFLPFIKGKILKVLLINGLIFGVSTVNAALTATTVKTIVGTEPMAIDLGGNEMTVTELLKIQVPKIGGGTVTYNPTTTPPLIILPTGTKIENIKAYVIADGTERDLPTANYYDADGDAGRAGPVIATWEHLDYDNTTVKTVPAANLPDLLDPCKLGWKLTIKAGSATNPFKAESTYGDPAFKAYPGFVGQSFTYYFETEDRGFCSMQPNADIVSPSSQYINTSGQWNKTAAPHATLGGGYDSQWYLPYRGFYPRTVSSKNFPITGFAGAMFTPHMKNGKSYYTFSGSNANKTVDNTTGQVTLLKYVKTEEKLIATDDSGTSHSYGWMLRFWAKPVNLSGGVEYIDYTNTITSYCLAAPNAPIRSEIAWFSNSPKKLIHVNGTVYTSITTLNTALVPNSNYGTRSSGSLWPEWGAITKAHYPSSAFAYVGYYWTGTQAASIPYTNATGTHTDNVYYVVNLVTGNISYTYQVGIDGVTPNKRGAVCYTK